LQKRFSIGYNYNMSKAKSTPTPVITNQELFYHDITGEQTSTPALNFIQQPKGYLGIITHADRGMCGVHQEGTSTKQFTSKEAGERIAQYYQEELSYGANASMIKLGFLEKDKELITALNKALKKAKIKPYPVPGDCLDR
jgi:hypothetical protein